MRTGRIWWLAAVMLLPVLVSGAMVWGADEEPKKDEAGAGGGEGGGGGAPAPRGSMVMVDAVRMERVERWREVTGELRAVRRATIAAEVAGRVSAIDVRAGDRVEKGALIARQDDELMKIEAARAEANLATQKAIVLQRRADLEKAERDLTRYEDAFSRNSATELERDDARTTVAGAKARVAEAEAEVLGAEAELARARKNLRDMEIAAPFGGVIIGRRTDVGEWLTIGDPVAEIVETRELDAFLDVPEAVLRRLSPSTFDGGASAGEAQGAEGGEIAPSEKIEIVLIIDALPPERREFRMQVSGIVPVGDPLSRLFPVRVRLDNPDGLLRPGMSIIGLVPTGQPEEAMTVKRDAVRRSETGAFVYFDAGGVAGMAPVVPQYATRDRLVVRSAVLKPGMQVVIEGNERLFAPGQPIWVTNPPAPPSPAEAGAGAEAGSGAGGPQTKPAGAEK